MIRNRLILAYLLPTALLLLLGGGFVYLKAQTLLEDELGRRLVSVAQATTGALPSSDPRRLSQMTAQDTSTMERMRVKLENIRGESGVRRIFIFDRTLRSLVDTRKDVSFGHDLFDVQSDRVEVTKLFTGEERSTSSVMFTGKDDTWYKNGYAPILHEGRVVAVLGVEGSAEYFESLQEFRNALFVLLFVGLFLIVAVSGLVARSITRPVDALIDATKTLGRGSLDQPITLQTNDELQTLAEAFDEMRRDLLDRDEEMQMMLQGIAHEVRNPLGGMELFCGLLREEVDPTSQEAEYIGKIQKELEYLTCVVHDFLAFARRQAIDLERFSAHSFMQDIVGLLMWDLEAQNVSLSQGEAPEDIEITADREKLRQVLINLVRNAGQACAPHPGSVTLHVRSFETLSTSAIPELSNYAHTHHDPIPEPSPEPWTALLIQDTGSGIPQDTLENIFRPFFTTREKGSGLGLALTHKIVHKHAGWMAVASTHRDDNPDEHGTLMVVALPFQSEIKAAEMIIPEGWLG